MWMALSAIAWSPIGTAKLMMIGLATPTIDPLTGLKVGGRNGASPTNGDGSWPATGPEATGTANGSPGVGESGSLGGTANGSGGSATGAGSPGTTAPGTTGSPGASSGSASATPAPSV